MADSKVCVVGMWHLGSIVSACLSETGFYAVGVDKEETRVSNLNHGIPPLSEPGLPKMLKKNVRSHRLRFTTDLPSALKHARYIYVAYDLRADDPTGLSALLQSCRELAVHLENHSIVVVGSQVPVGTCEKIKLIIEDANPNLEFDVACVPENLRLGQGVERFLHPNVVVIGAESLSTYEAVKSLFSFTDAPKIRVSLRTAEMIKHALNTFLAMSISIINELANLCEKLNIDAIEVSSVLRLDERISEKMPLKPGLGFSGGTILRDLKALKKLGEEHSCPTLLIDAIIRVNEEQRGLVVRKLRTVYPSLTNLTIGVLGLTYKPGTSTLDGSVALEIIKDLKDEGVTVKAHDPGISMDDARSHRDFYFCSDPTAVAKNSDALIILTAWPQYSSLHFNSIKTMMKKPVIIDAQNVLDANKMRDLGFRYFGVGRP